MSTKSTPSAPTSSSAGEITSNLNTDNASSRPTTHGVTPPVMGEISSPHQLVDWVDTLLLQLENRFDDMSGQVGSRMNEMSNRIDALESSIQDLISGTTAPVTAQVTGTSNNADD